MKIGYFHWLKKSSGGKNYKFFLQPLNSQGKISRFKKKMQPFTMKNKQVIAILRFSKIFAKNPNFVGSYSFYYINLNFKSYFVIMLNYILICCNQSI